MMSTIIFGKICFLNGQIAKLSMSSKVTNYNGSSIDIKDGLVKITFNDISEKNAFEIYHIAYDFIDNFLLPNEINLSRAIIFLPNTIEENGIKSPFNWDSFEKNQDQVDFKEFTKFIAIDESFRQAVRDFHIGLLDTRSSAAHFYRAIEVLRIRVAIHNKNNRPEGWEDFKSKINLDEEDRKELYDLTKVATKSRHGESIGSLEYSRWLNFTKKLIIKTYNYLKSNQNS